MVEKLSVLSFLSLSLILLSAASSEPNPLYQCLSDELKSNISLLSSLYFPRDSGNYEPILDSRIKNLRFLNRSSKPLAIITPKTYSQVQITIKCCNKNRIRVRIRSGGHDFEGTSYTTSTFGPFVMIDLQNLRSISIDVEDGSAWVESGVTIGELYYAIAMKSQIHGFPAGIYSTVGVGGHFGGGGVGNLVRKYGLASDNVIDAKMIDSNGNLLDRRSMGRDVFWAIKGGGGASFGVIVSWKIRLVHVSPTVTIFQISKTLEQGAIRLFHKWQEIAHKTHKDLSISVALSSGGGAPMVSTFLSLFLGRADDLLHMMDKIFPELGVKKQDCEEMRWIESIVRFSGYPKGVTIEALKNNVHPFPDSYYKSKMDLVYKPIPIEALGELWNRCSSVNAPPTTHFDLRPYGGRMAEISESDTPFPHRKGVLFEIVYTVGWFDTSEGVGESHINWLRGILEFMAPFVSKDPRRCVVNGRDFDLGINDVVASGNSYSKGKVWGSRYFNNNFKRLALVKGEVDPGNFFYFEQSIPLLTRNKQDETA